MQNNNGFPSFIKHSWNQLKSFSGANKACCLIALFWSLAEEMQVLIHSLGSYMFSDTIWAIMGEGQWDGLTNCLLQPGDKHAVVNCSGAVVLKEVYEWEIFLPPLNLWLDV